MQADLVVRTKDERDRIVMVDFVVFLIAVIGTNETTTDVARIEHRRRVQ